MKSLRTIPSVCMLAVCGLLLASGAGLVPGQCGANESNATKPDGVTCKGVGWPAGHVSVVEPVEPPSQRLKLGTEVQFPANRLAAIDVQAFLDEDTALGSPPRVGISRPLKGPIAGNWCDTPDGGRLWTAAIVAEGAMGLRLHFVGMHLPAGAEIYVYSPNCPARVFGPYAEAGPRQSGEFWAGTVTGDVAHVEYHVSRPDAQTVPFGIDEVGHMFRNLDGPIGVRGSRQPLDCMPDTACYYPEWEDVSYSVAKVMWQEQGIWYLCTGQLLATDNGDNTPYFLTSAHNIHTQTAAQTAEFRWFHQHVECDEPELMVSAYSYDADLLATSGYEGTPTDGNWTLLMIKGVLPPGVFWSGWTTSSIPPGSLCVAIHHPQGSWKRWSQGHCYASDLGPWWHKVIFNLGLGTVDGGSAGSGIWTDGTTPADQLLFGNESFATGEVNCDYPATPVYYGKFSVYYPSISAFLAAGSDDAFEDNDSCAAAAALESGNNKDLVVKGVDEDWYRLRLRQDAQLDILLSFTDSYGNIDAELYDVCGGAVVASATSFTDDEWLTYVNLGPDADFYLRVYLADDTRNTYDMDVSGAYTDCNDNVIDDACDVDCDAPGCEPPNCGGSRDCNGNGIPDECEGVVLLGDMNGDGVVDGFDVQDFVYCLLDVAGPEVNCGRADFNCSGTPDIEDIPAFVAALLGLVRGPPHMGDHSNSGCLPGPGRDAWQCEEDDVIELTVDGYALHVLHRNATYNCCPDDIVITLIVEGSLLRLTEEEIATEPCYCICCYDVEGTVLDLAPGEYTVEFCWFDYETEDERCHLEDIVVPG
ncbi:MAG: hypothetical protein JXQ75_15775 [Phycisphaerae bacterium]|nr:hypothetical protein [Phycisphaerae bacterium]